MAKTKIGKSIPDNSFWEQAALAAAKKRPKDFVGDERHWPTAPDHVDILMVNEADGKVAKLVATTVMPYEARDFIERHMDPDDGVRYEMAKVGRYKQGDVFRDS